MSLKPQPPRAMPAELAQLGPLLIDEESPYRLIGDELYVAYHDEDFADLYHPEGKPALSPVLLAFVTVFQALENLSDRQAAAAVRLRLDWKYALHLPLDYAGFDNSVLCEFRARLVKRGAEARLFERVLEQLRAKKLFKQRGIQRTDSLSILTKVRRLTRLELVSETLRLALRALVKADPDWARRTIPPSWEGRYGDRLRIERISEGERTQRSSEIGQDGQWVLDLLAAPSAPEELLTLPDVQTLRTVWQQQFHVVDDQIQFLPPGEFHKPRVEIDTPHDPDARYSQKQGKGWVGNKLQVTETDDPDHPHLIVDIALTSSLDDDRIQLEPIAQRQRARDLLPSERYVDAGYMCAPTLLAAQARQEDLRGPVRTPSTPQTRLGAGIRMDEFQIDLEARTATCPAGHSAHGHEYRGKGKEKGIRFRFSRTDCASCPLAAWCYTGKDRYRSLTVRTGSLELQAARERAHTSAFKTAYAQHRSGIEGCLSALVRGQGIRRNRYIGDKKNNLRALFIGTAVNLQRSALWLHGIRPRKRLRGFGLAAPEAINAPTKPA